MCFILLIYCVVGIVDFIFSKDASKTKYDTLLVEGKDKIIPDSIQHLISDNFYEKE